MRVSVCLYILYRLVVAWSDDTLLKLFNLCNFYFLLCLQRQREARARLESSQSPRGVQSDGRGAAISRYVN